MNTLTLSALKKSITHWQHNVLKAQNHTLTIHDISSTKCPLCNYFNANCYNYTNQKCPISLKTNNNCGCQLTPWSDVKHAIINNTNTILQSTKQELSFLKSLLPKKSNSHKTKTKKD